MEFAPFGDVREVEIEDVVSLYHVRIAFTDYADKFDEHLFFSEFFPVNEMFPSVVVGERNQDDLIACTTGIAKLECGCSVGFDIELKPMKVGKGHSLEERSTTLHQVLGYRIGIEM